VQVSVLAIETVSEFISLSSNAAQVVRRLDLLWIRHAGMAGYHTEVGCTSKNSCQASSMTHSLTAVRVDVATWSAGRDLHAVRCSSPLACVHGLSTHLPGIVCTANGSALGPASAVRAVTSGQQVVPPGPADSIGQRLSVVVWQARSQYFKSTVQVGYTALP